MSYVKVMSWEVADITVTWHEMWKIHV